MKEPSININTSVNADGSHFNKNINPFTAPALTFLGWKMHGWPAYSIFFQIYNTPTFSVMRFDENPSTCQSKNGDRKG